MDGRVYDVSPWVEKHPGGQVLSSLAGEDVSILFHTSHLRDVSEFLRRFQIGQVRDYVPGPTINPEFLTVLKQRVLAYFMQHRVEYRQTSRLKREVILSLVAFAGCWVLAYVCGYWGAAIPMGLISCAMVGGFAHEYSHSTFSKSDNRRTLAATLSSWLWSILFPFMPEKYFQYEHFKHHVLPMDPAYDYEVTGLRRFMRLSWEVPHRWYFRYQAYYAPLVYCVYIFIQFIEGFLLGFFRQRSLKRDPALRFTLYATLAFSALMHIVVPILCAGPLKGLLAFGLFIATWQFSTYIVAATVHMTDPDAEPSDDWGLHVCRHTRNVLCGNSVYDWLSGGFNYQIEHHLLPAISRESLPLVQPIIRETCLEFDYPYYEYRSFFKFFADHYRYLAALGQPGKDREVALEQREVLRNAR